MVFSAFFGLFGYFSKCFVSVCFGCFTSIPKQRVSMFRFNRNKQKTNRNSLIESIFWYFYENLGLFRFFSVCFDFFDIGSKHRNKPNFFVFGFTKQTKTKPKQILFQFVSFQTEIFVCLSRGHPSSDSPVSECPCKLFRFKTVRDSVTVRPQAHCPRVIFIIGLPTYF
jgi:hypothetical protein